MTNPANLGGGPLSGIQVLRDVRTKRCSSYDREGGNRDACPIEPGRSLVLADIKGAGRITHIWFTIGSWEDAKNYLRKLVLRVWWDGEKEPSIEVPVGDFFGMGHSRVQSYQSLPFNVSTSGGKDNNFAAFNCYWPMPFGKRAKLVIDNEGEARIASFYYYVDYEEHDRISDQEGRFHAQWRRVNPCPGREDGREEGAEPNLTGKDNYIILEAKGRGHYVGCNYSVHNLHGGWWGEGDDMFFIDGEKWPPSLHGTGSEDYFGHAWGMQDNHGSYNGVSLHIPGGAHALGEKITVYRYHIQDPVHFAKSLNVSIEHGHANRRSDDVSSTAFWYQTEPHASFPPLPSVEERLPRRYAVTAKKQSVAQFCRGWLVIGPFKNTKKGGKYVGLDTVYPPETEFNPDAQYEGLDGRIVQWKEMEADENGILNLLGLARKDAVAYARTGVYSKVKRKARLLLGSDDGVKVWVNGEEVHSINLQRGCVEDEDKVEVTLKAGWNVILLKCEQREGGWELKMRVTSEEDLSYAAAPLEM